MYRQLSEYRNSKIGVNSMICCSRDQTNYEQFFCQLACENKRIWNVCPFRKTAQIQLDLSGYPIETTPAILVKRWRKSLQNSDKYLTKGVR